MKKIVSVVLIVCMLFMSFTINVFAQTTDTSDKITLTVAEVSALYAGVNKNIEPDFCFGKQIGNAGDCALLFCSLRFDMPYEKVEEISNYKVTFNSSVYSLYIYDNKDMYSLKDAVESNIVTMDEVFEGYNPNEHPYYDDAFKIEKLQGYYGDANKDDDINVLDATEIQKAGLGITKLKEDGNVLADVNGDNMITILDVTCIQKYIADTEYDTDLVGEPYYLSK